MASSVDQVGPLHGLRVLDLGNMISGPTCARYLADFGADVVKVELPQGDPARSWRARFEGRSLLWAVLARNKRPIVLDLRTPNGRDTARSLAEQADVVVENFRPGTLEGWGLDYESLSARNPGLILVRISGYGQSGPMRDRPGFAAIAEAVGGLTHMTGHPDCPPSRTGLSLADTLAGLYGAFGALLALEERRRSGRGQVVDVALNEVAFSLLEDALPAFDKLGLVRQRSGAKIPGIAPSNLYPTADQRWVMVGANNNNMFRRLAQAMGQPELADDPRYATDAARADQQDELDGVIADWTCTRPASQLLAELEAAGIPCGPVNSIREIAQDSQLQARGLLEPVETDGLGTIRMAGPVPRLWRTPGRLRHGGKDIGADSAQVLDDWLAQTRRPG